MMLAYAYMEPAGGSWCSYHRCHECGEEFNSESNLKYHLKTHREKTIPCFGDYSGCGMLFECISTMMLHLEAGNCPCGMDRDRVDELAFECYQHRQYTNSWHEYFRYRCPDCDKDFSKFSGLLQHAESERCDADVGETPLCKALHYIDKRA